MDSINTIEVAQRDGLRCTFNVWPNSRIDAHKNMVPCTYVYTPLNPLPANKPPMNYDPIRCKTCHGFLNNLCQLDHGSKVWQCPLCTSQNQLPPHYAQHISPQSLPMELFADSSTVEYISQNRQMPAPVFFFVIDTTVSKEDLEALKDSLQQALACLPEEAYVGFISFGTMVYVHELGFPECARSYAIKGGEDFETSKICSLLGLPHESDMQRQASQGMHSVTTIKENSFIQPASECDIMLDTILSDLQKDSWPHADDKRPARCTGAALNVASCILESVAKDCGSRIMLFLGGPCTYGPGQVVQPEVTEIVRSHNDLEKKNAPLYSSACEYYNHIAQRCVRNGHTMDVFACSLDQIGLLELRTCFEKTGGLVVMADKFDQSMYRESLKRVFVKYEKDDILQPDGSTRAHPDDDHLQMGFNARTFIRISNGIQINGCIGPCVSMKTFDQKGAISESEVGECGTQQWYLGAIHPTTSYAYYFEVNNSDPDAETAPNHHCIQFITTYQHPSGETRIRVTTHRKDMIKQDVHNGVHAIAASFDAECAAVALGRMAVHRCLTEKHDEAIRFVDRALIHACTRFAHIQEMPGDDKPIYKMKLPPQFEIFPSMIFNLRRSQLLRTFNCSPDESLFYRSIFSSLPVEDGAVCIQPSLFSYNIHQEGGIPVDLDAGSVKPDSILLLDTFFRVVVFHGTTVAQWREAGYQNMPEHAAFAELLESPQNDSQDIMELRFPVPRYIVCDQGKSQARFLMNKINPSITHKSSPEGYGTQPGVMMSEDVHFNAFLDSLSTRVVRSQMA
eukprot:TRINITY_DN63808_c0_g1_i1.p1 TRINITY_DN63808_c0_g1~~TRINITY_DN63808_c0_g1_i1.p1  ORF type:complete len:793 (-),score=233.05 TRINITY_DN63808_c0_g1_i1:146-2524(-)